MSRRSRPAEDQLAELPAAELDREMKRLYEAASTPGRAIVKLATSTGRSSPLTEG